MSDIGSLVARLIGAGCSPEVAACVVTEAFAAGASCGNSGGIPVDITAEKRRAYDRERKARNKNSGGIPVEIPRNSENALSLSKEERKEDSKKVRKSRGKKIPPEWKPNAGHYAEGEKLRLDSAAVDAKAEDMRLWAESNEHRAVARKSDWDKTFTRWLRNNPGTGPPRISSQPLTPKQERQQGYTDVLNKLTAFNRAADADRRAAVEVLAPPGHRRSGDGDDEPDRASGGLFSVNGGANTQRDQWATGEVQVLSAYRRGERGS